MARGLLLQVPHDDEIGPGGGQSQTHRNIFGTYSHGAAAHNAAGESQILILNYEKNTKRERRVLFSAHTLTNRSAKKDAIARPDDDPGHLGRHLGHLGRHLRRRGSAGRFWERFGGMLAPLTISP